MIVKFSALPFWKMVLPIPWNLGGRSAWTSCLERIGPRILNFDSNWAPEKKKKYDALCNAVTTCTHFQTYIIAKMVVNKPAPQGQTSNEDKTGKRINILILGKDGICHPLAWKFNKSANVEKIYVQSRNTGTAMLRIPGFQDRAP